MNPSQEFCEMIKAAYENDITNVDFYSKLAEMAPYDDTYQELARMSNDFMKNSLYLNSIHAGAAKNVKAANANGCCGSSDYVTPYMMSARQVPQFMPYYEDTTMPELMDMIPAMPPSEISAVVDQPVMPYMYQPMMTDIPTMNMSTLNQQPMAMPNMQMPSAQIPNYSMYPPYNQTANIYPSSQMENNFMMSNMNIPMDQDYQNMSFMPAADEMPEEYKGIYDIPASSASESFKTSEELLTSLPEGTLEMPIPSLPDYIMTPASEEKNSYAKKVYSLEEESDNISLLGETDDIDVAKKPSTIPIPKPKTIANEKASQTNSKGNSKNNMLKNAFKDNKRNF